MSESCPRTKPPALFGSKRAGLHLHHLAGKPPGQEHAPKKKTWRQSNNANLLESPRRGREQFAPRSSRQASEPWEHALERMHGHVFLTGCFKCSPELFDQVLQTLFTVLLFAALTVAFITGYFIWARAEHTLGFESTQCIYK